MDGDLNAMLNTALNLQNGVAKKSVKKEHGSISLKYVHCYIKQSSDDPGYKIALAQKIVEADELDLDLEEEERRFSLKRQFAEEIHRIVNAEYCLNASITVEPGDSNVLQIKPWHIELNLKPWHIELT